MPKRKKNNNKATPAHILIVTLIILVLITTIVNIRAIATEEENENKEETSTVTYVLTSDGYNIPVPEGYTASQIDGETLGKSGFVIYEGEIDWNEILTESLTEEESTNETTNDVTNSEETTEQANEETEDGEANSTESTESTSEEIATTEKENILNLQSTVNQYVWVPVSNVSRIFGTDSTEKIWGKLYTYESGERISLNWTEENGLLSITNSEKNQEPGVSLSLTSYDIDSKLESYLDGTTRYEYLTKELEQSYYNIIQSIKKYGGFYIGRYETGGLTATAELQDGEYTKTTVVQKMNSDTTGISWYDMYEKCKTLSGTNNVVETSMIWGSLWDETLQWFADTQSVSLDDETTISNEIIGSDSTAFGNYKNSEFEYYESSEGWEKTEKKLGNTTLISTGSSEYTKINNIYDMAGNVQEWTIEVTNDESTRRISRGGNYSETSSLSYRDSSIAMDKTSTYTGCRAILYIK